MRKLSKILILCILGLFLTSFIPEFIPSSDAVTYSTIRFRRGTQAQWTTSNPILMEGEPGFETDTYQLKIGDGSTHWLSLNYYSPTISSTSTIISSLFRDSGKTQLFTIPDVASDTLAVVSAAQSLYLKTLVTPVIGTFYQDAAKTHLLTVPATTDTLVVQADLAGLQVQGNTTGSGKFVLATGATMTTPIIPSFYQDAGQTYLLTAPAKSGTIATTADVLPFPAGMMMPYAARTPPAGWLVCDGSAVSRSTYSPLFAAIVPTLGHPTITISNPEIVLTSHILKAGDAVYWEDNSGDSLPTGFSKDTIYYVIATGLTTDDFELSATKGGTAITPSGTQSGTHTLRHCPYGLGNASTTFNLPDFRGRAVVGEGTGAGAASSGTGLPTGTALTGTTLGGWKGEETHALTIPELAAHTHTITDPGHGHNIYDDIVPGAAAAVFLGTTPTVGGLYTQSATTGISINSTGSGTAHNTMPPIMTVNMIIKY